MSEDVTPAAEPSPAATPETPPPAEAVEVPKDPEAYAEWRQTGKLPSPEESAPSKKTRPSPEDSAPSKRQKNADSRKEELNSEIRELLAKRDQLRGEVNGGKTEGVNQAESPPAPKPAEPRQRPKKPKYDDFDTWEAKEAADDKYVEELADYMAEKKIEQYIQQQQQAAATRTMQERLDAASARYGEEAEPKILHTATTVFEDKGVAVAVKVAMNRSPVLVDALYVLGSDSGKLADFVSLAKKDPIEAMREWFVVEGLVKQELAKAEKAEVKDSTPAQGPDGKFLPSAKPKTPAPPVELGGKSSPPGDERDRAAAAGNVRAFFQEGNRRDFARWKGQT
jgi:hypothetical protein